MSYLKLAACWLFSLVMWVFIALLTTVFLLFILILKPFETNQRITYRIPNIWGYLIARVNPFWRIALSGREHLANGEGAVIVANHKSFADIICLHLLQIHFKWIAKDSLFRIPVIGWVMSLVNYIPLQRGRQASIKVTYREALTWLGRDISIVIFPEGTRNRGAGPGSFKNGAFKLAIEAQKPVIPVVIHGSDEVTLAGSKALSPSMDVSMSILGPIETRGMSAEDFGQLRDRVHAIMSAEYERLALDKAGEVTGSEAGEDSLAPGRIEQ